AQVVSAITSVASFLLFCWIVMRSSFAALIEVDTHRLDIRASWRLTRGAFWRLMWTAVLCFLWAVLLILFARGLFYVLGTVIAFVVGQSQQQFHLFVWPETGDLWELFGPGPLIRMVLAAAELSVAYCVACGALVYAYRSLRQTQEDSAEG
ncbi:MAG TPA: hypothetical protein VEA44_12965, partial [Caulobacter sp.]|nr:hypothetical protein [Caulobacter sp.]